MTKTSSDKALGISLALTETAAASNCSQKLQMASLARVQRYGRVLLSLLLIEVFNGCSSTSNSQDTLPTDKPSLVERVEDTLLAADPPPSGPLPKADGASPPPSPSKPSEPLPPPKKEPWMDTLLDLSGIPAPNSAVLLEEDPLPKNLSSVQILLSQRYNPKKPVSLSLRVYVTETGTVRRVQVLRSSDPKLTEEYFLPPLLELRFSPALYNGKPTSAWTTIHLQIKP